MGKGKSGQGKEWAREGVGKGRRDHVGAVSRGREGGREGRIWTPLPAGSWKQWTALPVGYWEQVRPRERLRREENVRGMDAMPRPFLVLSIAPLSSPAGAVVVEDDAERLSEAKSEAERSKG